MSHLLKLDYPNAWQQVIKRARRGKDIFADGIDRFKIIL